MKVFLLFLVLLVSTSVVLADPLYYESQSGDRYQNWGGGNYYNDETNTTLRPFGNGYIDDDGNSYIPFGSDDAGWIYDTNSGEMLYPFGK